MSQPFTSGDGFLASASRPPMDESDIIANLRAERAALAERLRQTPDMREVIAELRMIHSDMQFDHPLMAKKRLADLLRRLDESE